MHGFQNDNLKSRLSTSFSATNNDYKKVKKSDEAHSLLSLYRNLMSENGIIIVQFETTQKFDTC